MISRAILALLVCAPWLLPVPAAAGDWPHWRGPGADGTSPETGLPTTWSPTSNVLWKLPLPGVSGSTPVVWGDRIFLNVADGEKLAIWAVDRKGGKVLWERSLSAGNEAKRKGNLSAPSPVTDGQTVWTLTGTGIVAAFSFDGEPLWSRDLQADYGKFGILHGYSSSPLLFGNLLIVQVLHGFSTDDPSYVLAVDPATGETRWRVTRPTDAPREAPDAYTTPALLALEGRTELVISGADYVTGHDLATGREIWRLGGLNPEKQPMYRVVASPVIAGELIVVPTRVKPLQVFRVGKEGAPEKVWSTDDGPDVPTPTTDGKYLYILNDRGILWCLELATGKAIWGPERIKPGSYSASPLLAEGRLYATSETGWTTVLAAGPKFEVLAENNMDENTLASLAAASGQLFLRTAEHLWCLEGAKGGGGGPQEPAAAEADPRQSPRGGSPQSVSGVSRPSSHRTTMRLGSGELRARP